MRGVLKEKSQRNLTVKIDDKTYPFDEYIEQYVFALPVGAEVEYTLENGIVKYIKKAAKEKPTSVMKEEEKPDWDKIAEGKVRHGVCIAFIGIGVQHLTEDVKQRIKNWVDFIIKGE